MSKIINSKRSGPLLEAFFKQSINTNLELLFVNCKKKLEAILAYRQCSIWWDGIDIRQRLRKSSFFKGETVTGHLNRE